MITPDASIAATTTFISAPDGLRLHARLYGQRSASQLPVICLPGLARTTADFENGLAGPRVQARGRRPRGADSPSRRIRTGTYVGSSGSITRETRSPTASTNDSSPAERIVPG